MCTPKKLLSFIPRPLCLTKSLVDVLLAFLQEPIAFSRDSVVGIVKLFPKHLPVLLCQVIFYDDLSKQAVAYRNWTCISNLFHIVLDWCMKMFSFDFILSRATSVGVLF